MAYPAATTGQVAAAALVALIVAGCGAGQAVLSDTPPAPPLPDLAVEGRWMLSAPNAPSCGLNFSSAPEANEGRVRPDGGCPANFYTARRWTLQGDTLTIVDDETTVLGTFKRAAAGFDGKSAANTTLALSR